MLRIMVIGNGFDLYHKLPTRYSDFMFLATEWDGFYSAYETCPSHFAGKFHKIEVPLTDKGEMTQEALSEFGNNGYLMNKDHIGYLKKNLQSNAWIQYFRLLQLEGLRWVDFENEIRNALSFTEEYFTYILPKCGKPIEEYNYVGLVPGIVNTTVSSIEKSLKTIPSLPAYIRNVEYLFGWAVDMEELPADIYLKKSRKHNTYEQYRNRIASQGATVDKAELLRKKDCFISTMLRELQKLICCLDYYLTDFVGILKCEGYSEQILKLGPMCVLNFNYTNTFETLYGGGGKCLGCHQVHGGIQEHNIVLGISDDEFPKTLDYIRFQKYFQRIQKRTGSTYREWFEPLAGESVEKMDRQVYIMGHSLGVVDFGVLEDFFTKACVQKITIFYYNQRAYEELVINLVAALGREYIIEQIGCGRIVFEELQPCMSK